MRQRGRIVFAEKQPSDDRIAGPLALIRFDPVNDAENQIHNPATHPKEPDHRKQKHESRGGWFGTPWGACIAEPIMKMKNTTIAPIPITM